MESNRLVDRVKDHLLSEDLKTKQTEDRHRIVTERLSQSRMRYLKEKALMSHLEQQSSECPVLRQLLSLQRVTDQKKSLGIDDRVIRSQRASYSMAWKKTRPTVLEGVARTVEHDCNKLLQWTDSTDATTTTGRGRLKRIPLTIQEKISAIKLKKEEIMRLKRDISKKNLELHKIVSGNCRMLLSYISDYQLQYLAQDTRVTLDHMACKTDALIMKLNVVKLQLMVDTYTPDKVEALHIIRSHLDQRKHQLEVRLSEVQQSLRHYQSLGSSFMAIATEYHKLLEEIENKEWALTELRKTKT